MIHSYSLASTANDERSMYSYTDDSAMVDTETQPMPVDAAAALAAAFGIGFDDMATDRSSPLDQRRPQPIITSPKDNGGPFNTDINAWNPPYNDSWTPPLDAAAALAASFGIGFDFSGSSGEGPGTSTQFTPTTNPEWTKANTPPHSSSAENSPDAITQRQQPSHDAEQPVDAAAALAASFGFGFDNEESRDRRLGKVRRQSEVRVAEEIQEEQASKTASGKPRKKFKKRSGTTRERTGCLTCRQRRKKCDENTYPICGHCRRLNLECVREAPRAVHISVGNAAAPAHLPSAQPTTISTFYDAQSQISAPHNATPLPTQNALTHRRQSSSFGDLSHIAMHGVNFRISIPPCLSAPSSSDGGSDRRYLLKYYTQVLASLVTTNHENNSFLSVFLPMAIDSPPLLSALTAWSCAHLSRFHEPYAQPLMHRRGAALRLMAESLANPSPSLAMQETLLAASLVLCSMEVINGDTEGQWLRHLEGASLIIKAAKNGRKHGPEALRDSGDGEWLLRNFAYHDVLGSVTLGKSPLIRGAYWLEEDGRNGMVDTYMGVGSEILAFISEISCLVVPGQEGGSLNVETDGNEIGFEQRADELEQGLLTWTAPDAIQPGLVPLAEAWRSAALLCLYRKRRSYSQFANSSSSLGHLSQRIAHATSEILNQLSLIPPSSLPESGVLFPIFLAGGETRNVEEIIVIRQRLREMEGFRGFANIGKAMECLEEVWRLWGTGVRGQNGEEVGWEDVCRRRGWVLMLA